MTVTGTSEFNGTVDVDANFAVRSGTTDKFTVASATGNTVVQGNLTINGSLSAGNLTGNADTATDININETANNQNYQVTFSTAGGVTSQSNNHYRQLIDNDNAHFLYNPSTYSLSGLNNVAASTMNATTFTGALSGNASSATQLQTARNLSLIHI